MIDVLEPLTALLKPHLTEVSLMLMTTLLVVYGDVINKQAKRLVAPYHFLIRTGAFVLLCAFGYGALTLFGAPLLTKAIALVPYAYQGLVMVVAFLCLGYLAQRRRYI